MALSLTSRLPFFHQPVLHRALPKASLAVGPFFHPSLRRLPFSGVSRPSDGANWRVVAFEKSAAFFSAMKKDPVRFAMPIVALRGPASFRPSTLLAERFQLTGFVGSGNWLVTAPSSKASDLIFSKHVLGLSGGLVALGVYQVFIESALQSIGMDQAANKAALTLLFATTLIIFKELQVAKVFFPPEVRRSRWALLPLLGLMAAYWGSYYGLGEILQSGVLAGVFFLLEKNLSKKFLFKANPQDLEKRVCVLEKTLDVELFSSARIFLDLNWVVANIPTSQRSITTRYEILAVLKNLEQEELPYFQGLWWRRRGATPPAYTRISGLL